MTIKTMFCSLLILTVMLPGCATGGTEPVGAGANRAEPASDDAKPPTDDAEPPTDGAIELRLDHPRAVAGTTLTWTGLSDSRCPQGVNCIWAGEVSITLTVTEGKSEPKTIELKLTPRSSEGADRSRAKTEKWDLQLLSVEPYPTHEAKADRGESVARVTVTPR